MLNTLSLTRSLALAATIAVCAVAAQAQTTILNVPSTDVQTTQKAYFEADFVFHLDSLTHGGFQGYTEKVIYGPHKKMEVGVNLSYTKSASTTAAVEIQPNFKWQAYENEDKGIAVATGGALFLPVSHRQNNDTLGLLYVTASKKVKAKFGPRITGGTYRLLGLDAAAGNRGGGVLGYEQPVTKKLNFLADWYSGKNRLGYATAGFGATLTARSVLYVAYSFGNNGRGNNGLTIFVGRSF